MRHTGSVTDEVHARDRFTCRSCRSAGVTKALDLGLVPASDSFPPADAPTPDEAWPLELYVCPDCSLVQLGPAAELPPEQPGPVDSATAVAHAAGSVADVMAEDGLQPGQTFVEYDSGHGGSWIPRFLDAGMREVEGGGPLDLVVDVHNLMHEPDLDAVLGDRAARVAPGGVFVAEFFHALPMVEQTLIDTVRHGHYVYLTLTAVEPALARHGLVVTRATTTAAYGGSLRIAARRASESPAVDLSVGALRERERIAGLVGTDGVVAMADRAGAVAQRVRQDLDGYAARGRSLAGYGAPSKAAVLLALTGVDGSLLPYTVDRSPAKHGRRVPGAGVPIRPVEALLRDRPDTVVVLTWDIADEVAAQLAELAKGSGWAPELFVPLPIPRVAALGQR